MIKVCDFSKKKIKITQTVAVWTDSVDMEGLFVYLFYVIRIHFVIVFLICRLICMQTHTVQPLFGLLNFCKPIIKSLQNGATFFQNHRTTSKLAIQGKRSYDLGINNLLLTEIYLALHGFFQRGSPLRWDTSSYGFLSTTVHPCSSFKINIWSTFTKVLTTQSYLYGIYTRI